MYNEKSIEELRSIADRLNELELHDEARSILHKADTLAAGGIVISTETLQRKVNESVILTDIYHEFARLRSTSTSLIYSRLVGDALVEVAKINGGSISENDAFKLVGKKFKVHRELMKDGIHYAHDDNKLTRAPRSPFTLTALQ